MKIEKISDNQIRCTLNSSDLTDRQLNLGELAYGSDKARRLFREMMQQAFNDFGFEAEDNPLMVEAIPLSNDSIMLIITKVDDPEELDTRFAKFSPSSEEDFSEEEAPAPETLEGAPAPTASESPELPRPPGRPDFSGSPPWTPRQARPGDRRQLRRPQQPLQGSRIPRLFPGHKRPGLPDGGVFSYPQHPLRIWRPRKANDAREAYFREHYDTVIDGLAVQVLKSL